MLENKSIFLVITLSIVGVLFLFATAMLLWVFVISMPPVEKQQESVFEPETFDTMSQQESDKIVLDLLVPSNNKTEQPVLDSDALDFLTNNTAATTSTTSAEEDAFFDYSNYVTPQKSLNDLEALMR